MNVFFPFNEVGLTILSQLGIRELRQLLIVNKTGGPSTIH